MDALAGRPLVWEPTDGNYVVVSDSDATASGDEEAVPGGGGAGQSAAATSAGGARAQADKGMTKRQYFGSLLQKAADVGAGLEAGTRKQYERARNVYLEFVDDVMDSGALPRGDPKLVTTQALVAFMFYLCQGCAAAGQPQVAPQTMIRYKRAVLRACELGADGWRYPEAAAGASAIRQAEYGLFKAHPTYKARAGGLTVDQVWLLSSRLDQADLAQAEKRALLLMAFWAGSRGGEMTASYLTNTCVDFELNAAGQPTAMIAHWFNTKAWKAAGEVKNTVYHSQEHPDDPTAEHLDAVTALYDHMKRQDLLPTEEEKLEHQRWQKRGRSTVMVGRPIFRKAVAGAENITKWLRSLCMDAGLDTTGISSRSLRVGAVNAYLEAGATGDVTKAQVGHQSDAGQRAYIRPALRVAGVGALQARMAAGAGSRAKRPTTTAVAGKPPKVAAATAQTSRVPTRMGTRSKGQGPAEDADADEAESDDATADDVGAERE